MKPAYDNNVPIFCPAFTDSSAGFGLVMHQEQNPDKHITIDSIREFRELTEIKLQSKQSGLLNGWWRCSKEFYSRHCCMCRIIREKRLICINMLFKLLLQTLVMELVVVQR